MGAEAIVRALQAGSGTVRVQIVDNRTAFVEAIDGQQWDAVVCDYVLKDFNGREALDIHRARKLDIPFICISGEISGEAAAAIVREGANDFLTKSHMAKLRSVLDRELAAAESRRHRKHVAETSMHLAAIVEGTDDAIFSRDMEGTILTWNAAAESMYGYSAEEAVGRPISIIVPPEYTYQLKDILNKLKSGQRIERMEAERLRKDGTRLFVSMTISPVKNAGISRADGCSSKSGRI